MRADVRAPLVSIIVRSMGRPELGQALASIAQQDHPAIEAIVVDATGGRHPALPPLRWPDGHAVRLVSRAEPLKRPQAAAVGLESARGDWFTFLDDDDTCEPEHVSTLVAAAHAHPGALVVYGCGQLRDAQGQLREVFGRPFNRAMMHYGPLFYWQSALISRRVRDLGCRFDAMFDVCEDRDFLAQVAEHCDFVFVPDAATFRYRPDLGTSGTGAGANRNVARVARFENLLRAKWAGQGVYHNERAATRCRNGVRAYFAGDLDAAQSAFGRALADYPDDPNAIHGLARVALARRDLEAAERSARRAIAINPVAVEYRATLTEIVAARRAVSGSDAPIASRMSPCPCGSGLRYKACCGRVDIAPSDRPRITAATDPLLWQVDRCLARGEAQRARTALQAAVTQGTASRQHLVKAARLELDLDCAPAAFMLLQRAAALSVDVDVGLMLDECCARLARDESRASLWEMAARVCRRSWRDGRSQVPATGSTLRIAADSTPGREPFRQAALLRDCLGVTADAGIVLPGEEQNAVREDGVTLILIEPDGRWEQLAARLHPRRIVVRLTRDDPEALLRCLTRLEEAWPRAALQFTRPHAGAGGESGLPMPVEYPWIDPALFVLDPPGRERPVIGRAGPALPGDDHPDDGALYRDLIAKGWKVQLPQTQFLESAFADDALPPMLTRENDAAADLEALDVVVLRGVPTRRGFADDRVLAAMAAARPVVVFAHALGAREWIANGETGFVVETEDEARQSIARLAASSRLRTEIGIAARRVAAAAMDEQRSRARAFYLGVSLNE